MAIDGIEWSLSTGNHIMQYTMIHLQCNATPETVLSSYHLVHGSAKLEYFEQVRISRMILHKISSIILSLTVTTLKAISMVQSATFG